MCTGILSETAKAQWEIKKLINQSSKLETYAWQKILLRK